MAYRMLLALLIGAATALQDELPQNELIASYSALPDPFHWVSFYSLPRTLQAARNDGWAKADDAETPRALSGLDADLVSVWCRRADYRVCLVFDKAEVVAGLQVSISVADFEQSNKLRRYPIEQESQWRRQRLAGTEVFSATAMFVPVSVLQEGGRANFSDSDNTIQGLFLENGMSYWAMPSNAKNAADVAYTKQGCVQGMGRHFFYDMSPKTACEAHRPFFLLFDDVTGHLHGFGITLFSRTSHSWRRWWLEAPWKHVVQKMIPSAPECLQDWSKDIGLTSLHVYFRPSPWKAQCVDK